MRIDPALAERIIAALFEGCYVRSCERLFGVHRDTVCDLVLEVGERCQRFFLDNMVHLDVSSAQVDEIWSWAGCRQKTAERKGKDQGEYGDVWIHTAICPQSKMMLAYHCGRRGDSDTHAFAHKLARAVAGRVQVNSDGLTNYLTALPEAFGNRVDHAAVDARPNRPVENIMMATSTSTIENAGEFCNVTSSQIR